MMSRNENRIIVYYDAACPKCVKDRQSYEQMAGESGNDVCWRDITGRDDELWKLGIDPCKALIKLHVQDQHGRIFSEINAYILLMQRVPRLRPVAWLIGLPLIRPIVAFLYHCMVNRRLQCERRQ